MTRITLTLTLGAAALLAGCGGTHATTLATTTTSPVATAPARATSGAAQSTTAAAPAPTSATGTAATACTAGGPVPGNAASKTIADVDGDGRADTGFIYAAGNGTPVIGVHTAAGGTFVADFTSASGAQTRSVTFARVSPGGPVVALTDDNRLSQLFAVQGCLLQPVMNAQGQQYQFDLRNFSGTGDGVTCGTVAGQGATTLVGFHYLRDSTGKESGGETRTAVALAGTTGTGTVTATNGKTETVTGTPDPAGISCGSVLEATDAISLPAS